MASPEGGGEGGAAAFILPALMGLGNAAGNLINSPKNRYKWNKKAAEDSNAMNRENQQWMLEQERELQREQREYDSPEAQMKRYIAAGLNPHMIYGGGSASAGGAFPINAGNIPAVNIDSPGPIPNYPGAFIAGAQTGVNMLNTAQRTDESNMRTQAIEVQKEIAKNNPMLDPAVASSVSESMMNAAKLKSAESWYSKNAWYDSEDGSSYRVYAAKIRAEVENMSQRLGLNTADLAIKNKILQSKEFENAVKEIQAKWLKDGDVSPEHIRQGLMLILNKMMSK